MAAISFPSFLPGPEQKTLVIQPVDPVVRTQMDSGSPRSRRRFTSYPSNYPVTWIFTQTEMAVFEAWHNQAINDGASWFNIDLPNGLGISSYEAKFQGTGQNPWKAALQPGLIWKITATLEVRSRPTLSLAALAASWGVPTINAQIGAAYSFALGDVATSGANKLVTLSNALPITATLPAHATVPFPVGAIIPCEQTGIGKVTLAAAASVTIDSPSGNFSISAQNAGVVLIQVSIDTWYPAGALIP